MELVIYCLKIGSIIVTGGSKLLRRHKISYSIIKKNIDHFSKNEYISKYSLIPSNRFPMNYRKHPLCMDKNVKVISNAYKSPLKLSPKNSQPVNFYI